MITYPFHDSPCTAVADGKAFTGNTGDKGSAGGGAVKGHVANEGILRIPAGVYRGTDGQCSAGKAFSQGVVCHAVECNGLPLGQKGAERLAAAALCLNMPFTPQERAECPVGGGQLDMILKQAGIGTFPQGKIVLRAGLERNVAGKPDQVGEVEIHIVPDPEEVAAADQFIDGPGTQPCHDPAQLSGNEAHEPFHVFRLSGEFLAQLGFLGSDAQGTGAQVADPHHAASHGNQRSGGKPEFLSAQQEGDRDIMSGHELSVGLKGHRMPQTVPAENLMRFGQSDFPGQTGVMHAGQGSSAGAAVAAGNQDAACTGFGDPAGNGSDTGGGNQFHRDFCLFIGTLQIVNQFSQIFNGVNVMMGRWRNEGNAGERAAGSGHAFRDL